MSRLPAVETLAARAMALPAGSVPDDLEVSFGIEVIDGASFTLLIRDGRVAVVPGTAAAALTVVLEADDAEAAAAGATNLQHLVAAGRVRIRGDLGSLPSGRLLAALGPLLADPFAPSD